MAESGLRKESSSVGREPILPPPFLVTKGAALGRRKKPAVNVEAVGLAYEWATKIITIAVIMVGPAWLCERLLGRTAWTLLALAVGVTAGFVYLLWLTGALVSADKRGNGPDSGSGESDSGKNGGSGERD